MWDVCFERLSYFGFGYLFQLDDQRADTRDYKPNDFFACYTLTQQSDGEDRDPDQHGAIDNAGLHRSQCA